MHDSEKSDSAIVAVKPPNKAGLPAAEAVERRAGAKGNADQQSTHRTQSRTRVTQALSRVRQAAGASPSNTQGRSRMLELGSSGSARGVCSNVHPYRDLSVSGYPPAYFDTTPRARAALHRSNKTRVVMAERGAHLPGPVVGATFAAR